VILIIDFICFFCFLAICIFECMLAHLLCFPSAKTVLGLVSTQGRGIVGSYDEIPKTPTLCLVKKRCK